MQPGKSAENDRIEGVRKFAIPQHTPQFRTVATVETSWQMGEIYT